MDLSLQRGFVKTDNTGFNYGVSGAIDAGEEVIIRFPNVTANKRGVNDIGWTIDGDAKLYATLAQPPYTDAIWQEIRPDDGINKTAAAVKVVAGEETSKVHLRVILS
jgi:hypothetical protein